MSAAPSPDPSAMPSPSTIARTLSHFASSSGSFQVVHTLPPSLARLPTRTLYVLDSSFNPPTFAHLRMCTSALLDDDALPAAQKGRPRRLLLLLATQNADKPAKPAAFEQRLVMMGMLAKEVKRVVEEVRAGGDRDSLEGKQHHEVGGASGCTEESQAVTREGIGSKNEAKSAGTQERLGRTTMVKSQHGPDLEEVVVDVGITKEAMFMKKAQAIEKSGFYIFPQREHGEIEQVHLTGFDTLIRLLDTKYYPPNHTLSSLKPLFDKHRVRVTRRPRQAWGPASTQNDYLRDMANGALERAGGKREWADRIQLVGGQQAEGDTLISSTMVRNDAKMKDMKQLWSRAPKIIGDYTVEEKLYKEVDE